MDLIAFFYKLSLGLKMLMIQQKFLITSLKPFLDFENVSKSIQMLFWILKTFPGIKGNILWIQQRFLTILQNFLRNLQKLFLGISEVSQYFVKNISRFCKCLSRSTLRFLEHVEVVLTFCNTFPAIKEAVSGSHDVGCFQVILKKVF